MPLSFTHLPRINICDCVLVCTYADAVCVSMCCLVHINEKNNILRLFDLSTFYASLNLLRVHALNRNEFIRNRFISLLCIIVIAFDFSMISILTINDNNQESYIFINILSTKKNKKQENICREIPGSYFPRTFMTTLNKIDDNCQVKTN